MRNERQVLGEDAKELHDRFILLRREHARLKIGGAQFLRVRRYAPLLALLRHAAKLLLRRRVKQHFTSAQETDEVSPRRAAERQTRTARLST
jgi:hypothetical protein